MEFTRSRAYSLGATGFSSLVMLKLLVQLPDGDAGETREAAGVWRRVADRIDQSAGDMSPVVANVLKTNNAAGLEHYWRDDFTQFTPHASAYVRRLAKATDDYADMLWHTQKTLIEMAIIAWLDDLMFGVWRELGGPMGPIQRAVEAAKRKIKAKLLLKILERYGSAIFGSVFFAIADQIIVDGVKLSFGEHLDSWSDQLKRMGMNFGACMIFYGVDQKKLKFLGKVLPKNEQWNKFLEFLLGSVTFTIAGNLESDPGAITHPQDLLPTWDGMINKVFVGLAQRGNGGWRRP